MTGELPHPLAFCVHQTWADLLQYGLRLVLAKAVLSCRSLVPRFRGW